MSPQTVRVWMRSGNLTEYKAGRPCRVAARQAVSMRDERAKTLGSGASTPREDIKDDESHMVPILDSLYPILSAWKLKTGGFGAVVPTMRSDGAFCDDHSLRAHLKTALEALKLPKMTWYQAEALHGADHRTLRPPQDGLVRRPRPWHYRGRASARFARTWYDWLRCGYSPSVGREKDSLSS